MARLPVSIRPPRGQVVIIEGIPLQRGAERALALHRGLARSLERLFDGVSAKEAWSAVLAAGKPVSIKLDFRSPLAATSDDLIEAVAENLSDNLAQPWECCFWDRRAVDTERRRATPGTRRGVVRIEAGERVNQAQDATEGYNRNARYRPGWLDEGAAASLFSKLLDPAPPTLINLPSPKHHPLVGIDGALLGLAMGSVNNTQRFYESAETLVRATVEILKHKTLNGNALTIMDATTVVYNGGPVGLPEWVKKQGAMIVGVDPVAVDAIGLGLINAAREEATLPPTTMGLALLEAAGNAGLGNNDPEIIRLTSQL